MQHRVFVYGTLKRGFPNAACMNGASFLGRYRTCDAYPLVVAGPWYSPSLLPERGTGLRVSGELYEVNDETLAALDVLESVHLPNGYTREQVQIASVLDSATTLAWVYFKARDRLVAIHTDYLEDYQDQRYVPLSQRTG